MRGIYFVVVLVLVLGFSESSYGASKEKEHLKKKTILKLRTEASPSESSTGNVTVEVEKVSTGSEGENSTAIAQESPDHKDKDTVVPTIDEEVVEITEVAVSKPKPSYLSKFLYSLFILLLIFFMNKLLGIFSSLSIAFLSSVSCCMDSGCMKS